MNLGREYPELLADLAAQLRELLITQAGLSPEQAESLALTAADHIRQHWGGQIVYVPTGARYETMQQWRAIWREFTGDNVPALAQKYGHTEVHVYYILRRMREIEQRERQPQLFPESK